jgi:TPR repeat protein
VPQDYSKAKSLYEKASGVGDTDAMFNLGVLYQNGQGVPQDYSKAASWYEKAAAAGNVLAKNQLTAVRRRKK